MVQTANINKIILPETLIISELYDRNSLPIQQFNFSSVKNIKFQSDNYYKERGAEITNEFISHVLRSSENLEKVYFCEDFDNFITNTSNLLVIPTQRKLKFLSMRVVSPEQKLSQLLMVLAGLADKVNLWTKKCKLDLNISYEADKS